MKPKGKTVFSLIMLLLFVIGLCFSVSWSVEARLFPLLITIVGTILCMWLFIAEIIHIYHPENLKEKSKREEKKASIKLVKTNNTPSSELIIILWVSVFLGLILLLGFWVAIIIFIPLFMSFFGLENWKISTSFTLGIWLVIYFIFSIIMRIPLYGGVFRLSW